MVALLLGRLKPADVLSHVILNVVDGFGFACFLINQFPRNHWKFVWVKEKEILSTGLR